MTRTTQPLGKAILFGAATLALGATTASANGPHFDLGTTTVSGSHPVVPFHDSMASIPGLGANQKLCPTDCATTSGPAKGRVLACYAVCQTAPKLTPVTTTTYTRVVHPVIYVRYPVPYSVPYAVPGKVHYSRYGHAPHGFGGGFGIAQGFGGGCGGYPVAAPVRGCY